MTIAIGVAVPEGLILAADSRTTCGNAKQWPRIATDNAQKVFRIREDAMAATSGWAGLNGKIMARHVTDFIRGLPASLQGEALVDSFCDFFQSQYDAHIAANYDKPVSSGLAFNFFLATYDLSGEGILWRLRFPGKIKDRVCSTFAPGTVWEGQYDALTRLMRGCDPRLDIGGLPADVRKKINDCTYVVYNERMTLQDAVDFAVFLARTVVDTQRFTDGIASDQGDLPGVGGPIDVAILTPFGFAWVRKKELHM